MCGRFTLRISPAELAQIFELLREPETRPRYNISPSQSVLCIRDGREPAMLKWGLIPSWSNYPKNAPINARADGIATKPSFRNAFKRKRCLIPADGFYEWKKLDGKNKQPYFIRRPDDKPFAFAGLWEEWKGPEGTIETCAIITTEPNAMMAELHDRMPVVLESEDYDRWLAEPSQDLLAPAVDGFLEAYPVSTTVNSPRNDVPGCVVPI